MHIERTIPESVLDDHIAAGKDYMAGIIEGLYGSQSLDVKDLEHCIEELGALFGIDIPEHYPNIRPAPYRGYTTS